jgi:hypothetical protein
VTISPFAVPPECETNPSCCALRTALASAPMIEPGDNAPDFELPDHDGRAVKLSDSRARWSSCTSTPRRTRRVVRAVTHWRHGFVVAVLCGVALPLAPPASGSLGSTGSEVAPCLKARHLPGFTAYDLGDHFAGLPLSTVSRGCFAPPPGDLVGPGPRDVTWTSTATYGTCTPEGAEGGCGPPLEVQSWPECDRDYAPYGPARDLEPRTSYRLSGSHRLPTISLEHGLSNRIEMYEGRTTVVVFTDGPEGPRLASLAVHALARQVVPRLRSTSFRRLRALAVSTRGCRR